MPDWILSITESSGAPGPSPRLLGGKAASLARLIAEGLPVPPGFVVSGALLEAALRAAGLLPLVEAAGAGDEAACEALHAAILELPVPAGVEEELVRAATRLGTLLAVRSSGADEDGKQRSFAGQYDTELGVAPRDVLRAVRRCWASAWSGRARAYRGGKGPSPYGMAVLVQLLVTPRTAGVMFTINPVTGSWREMTLEAVPGLGAGVVDGAVAPHWYLVRRPRRTPRPVQRVLARARLQVVQEDLPLQFKRLEVVSPGVAWRDVPPGERGERLLSHHDVRRLCRLGLRIEARLGSPQDIEWAIDASGRVWILQARPVTAGADPRARTDVLWTRRFLGERFPDPVTPMSWSLMEPLLQHFIAYPSVQDRYLGGGPVARLVHHRPYLNVSIFLHLAFKLPGRPPPRFMLELLPPEEVEAIRRRFAVLPDLAVYRAIFRETFREERWRRFAWNPWTNPDVWDEFERQLARDLPVLARPVATPSEAVRRVEALLDVLREYIGIHVCSLLFANLSDQLLEGALALWLPGRAERLYRALAVSPPGNKTLEVNAALATLGEHLGPEGIDALVNQRPVPDHLQAHLEVFLATFGHRSHASWDVMAPRWSDEPWRLGPLLRSGAGAHADRRPDAREPAFEEARREVESELGGTPRGMVLATLIRMTRSYLLLRENQRFRFEQVQALIQRLLLGLGATLVDNGILDEPGDVRFLTWPEVAAAVGGGLGDEVRGWVPRRRARWEQDWSEEPPLFLRGEEAIPIPEGASRLEGQGVSAGRATGRVVRARTLADAAALRPGDVLVAPAVDPGWTPLLRTAGGLVLEMGGRLSHGAVVAREYGVPAVVNVDGALHRLRDGQEVTVDGTRGIVYVHG